LVLWGIVAALVLRGLAIVGGGALIEQFHFVIYILGATLLLLRSPLLRGVDSALARLPHLPRGRREDGPGEQPVRARRAQVVSRHRRLRAVPLLRAPRRPPVRDATAAVPRGDGVCRHRVRGGLDSGRIR